MTAEMKSIHNEASKKSDVPRSVTNDTTYGKIYHNFSSSSTAAAAVSSTVTFLNEKTNWRTSHLRKHIWKISMTNNRTELALLPLTILHVCHKTHDTIDNNHSQRSSRIKWMMTHHFMTTITALAQYKHSNCACVKQYVLLMSNKSYLWSYVIYERYIHAVAISVIPYCQQYAYYTMSLECIC